MARFVRDVMTPDPRALGKDATAVEAARVMKEEDVGAVVITDGDEVYGILTDRDIVVRGIAEGRSPDEIKVGDIATTELTALQPDDSIDDAIRAVREKHIRRLPVVEDGRPVGILSIGDLALERDQESALAEISAAAPNN
jgi:CBS domain-containing protein